MLQWVRGEGLEAIALDQVPERLRAPRWPRFISFTFDDGYRDNCTLALPIFREFGVPFAVNVTNGFIAGTASVWWYFLAEALASGKPLGFTWDGTEHHFAATNSIEQNRALDEISGTDPRRGPGTRCTDPRDRRGGRDRSLRRHPAPLPHLGRVARIGSQPPGDDRRAHGRAPQPQSPDRGGDRRGSGYSARHPRGGIGPRSAAFRVSLRRTQCRGRARICRCAPQPVCDDADGARGEFDRRPCRTARPIAAPHHQRKLPRARTLRMAESGLTAWREQRRSRR